MLLTDAQLEAKLNEDPPLVAGLDRSRPYTDGEALVQASSIDLTMGKIFLPEVGADDLGGIDNPRREHSLEPGHTAVVETAERLNMPSDIAAIGFPPARVSARGLLATNPGHVDPGYSGHLSLTVINMGRDAFPLKAEEALVTLLFLQLDDAPDADYQDRQGKAKPTAVSADRLARLSTDFLEIEQRAKQIAKDEEARSRRAATWVAVPVAILTLLAAVFGVIRPTQGDLDELRGDVKVLQEQLNLTELEQRLEKLERRTK